MNSSINIQPSLGIPAGPLPRAKRRKKPVAAVIRPMPRQTGKQGSLRLDQAESERIPRAHARKFELGDYVKWLKEKIEADKLDSRQTSTELNVEASELANKVAERDTAFQTIDNSGTLYSTITDTDLVEVMGASPVESPRPSGVRYEQLPAVGFAMDRFDRPEDFESRIDEAHDSEQSTGSTNSHLSFGETDADLLEEEIRVSAKDTDAFISAVSKAIASVLTDRDEPELEQKVRDHFETELYARSIQALVDLQESESAEQQEEVEAIESAIENVINESNQPQIAVQSEVDKVASQIIHDSKNEIPVSIAAWDVEDFRWPEVTNQMIVSGAGAIDQLAQSAFSMLSDDHNRLAITGLGRDSGTSSIAITLARWVAALGKNVLLIDADISNPGLSTQVGLAPNLSWVNAVNQTLPASEVIVRSQKSNLCVMPLATLVSRSTWPRFIYDNLGELVDQVKDNFHLVIVDAGPSKQLLAELSRPRHLVDATLMVHDGANSPEFRRAKNMLEGFGLNKFIVAKNRTQRQNINVA